MFPVVKLTHHSFPLIYKTSGKHSIQRAAHCITIGKERQHPLLPSTNDPNEGRRQLEKQRPFFLSTNQRIVEGAFANQRRWVDRCLCRWFTEALEGGVRIEKRSWFGRIYCWVHGWVELISGAVFKLLLWFRFREVWFCKGRTKPMRNHRFLFNFVIKFKDHAGRVAC